VAETTVLRPLKDRPLYCLCYASRHERGIEVFRDCQVKALTEQSKARAATKVKHAASSSGQGEFFESLHDMGPDETVAFLDDERRLAEKALLALTPKQPASLPYDKLWPQVLARHVVRKPDVNAIAARMRDSRKLLFPDWEKGKRVPQPHYRAQRPTSLSSDTGIRTVDLGGRQPVAATLVSPTLLHPIFVVFSNVRLQFKRSLGQQRVGKKEFL
jgi:hypothetical protein